MILRAACLVAATIALAPSSARANERHFTLTYESPTLPQNVVEIEPWTTVRIGRLTPYVGVDNRIESEVGLTDRLQTSLYFNSVSTDAGGQGSFNFTGISSEWKYRVLTDGANPIGLSIYGELTLAPTFNELEAKVIVDHHFGRLLVAANLVYEHEWLYSGYDVNQQTEFEVDAAAGWFFTPHVMLGLEARWYNRATITPEWLYHESVLFAGPTLALSSGRFWGALSVVPQLGAPIGASRHDVRNLDGEEVVTTRLLLGVHL